MWSNSSIACFWQATLTSSTFSSGAAVPTRYAPDTGEVFGVRSNGWSYGWSSDHTDVARDRGVQADQRLDTLIHFHQDQKLGVRTAQRDSTK